MNANTCPRRSEHGSLEVAVSDDCFYRNRVAETDIVDGRCRFCGSMSGDAFMSVLDTAKITPTDKDYKVYVELEETELIGRNVVRKTSKFYFQHLSPEQKQAFVERMNAKTLIIGFPGHFYTTPYFVKVG